MCVFQCQPNCTIRHLGFRTRWIDDIECGLFSIHTLFGQTTLYVGQVSGDDYERKGEGETQCRLIACSSLKAPRVPAGLTSPSDGWVAINCTICFLNIYTVGRVWNLIRPVIYNLAISKCTSPPLLALRLKVFKWKLATSPGIEPQTCWTRDRHSTIWASVARLF